MKPLTNALARKVVSDEFAKRGWAARETNRNFIVNGKRVHVRGCDRENKWAEKDGVLGGWDKLNPETFDYLIGVTFCGSNMHDVQCFIFSQAEVREFPVTTLRGKERGLKNITLKYEGSSRRIADDCRDRWDKLMLGTKGVMAV